MDDNVEISVVSEKPNPTAGTLDVVTLYTDSPSLSGSDALRLETGSKISRRIRSSLVRSFSANNRTSSNDSGSGHDIRGLKKSSSLTEGNHAEGPGISSSGTLDGLNNGAGLLKKKRGLLKRKHAKNSWISGGNCGFSDIGFSGTVKGKKVSWIRKVGFSSALKNDGVDLGRSKKRKGRKEISLSCFEPVLKKRKSGSNGGFCFSSTGPTVKKSRSRVGVAKKSIVSGTIDDLKNLDQISDAPKGVAVINGSGKNDCMDPAAEKLHVEDGAVFTCRNHDPKPIESSKPKDCSSSVASRNHSKVRRVNSKDESRPLIQSLLNKRRKILKKITKDESISCASVLSLNDDGSGSVPKKMMGRRIRKRRISDGSSHVEMKALDGHISENDKETSCLGSKHAEPSSQVDNNVTEKDVHSQDRADEYADGMLPVDIKGQEPENFLTIIGEPSHASSERLSSKDADVQKMDKNMNGASQEDLDLRLECVEDSSNLSPSQADEQENLEQNAAQMLSSRFNSSCNNFVSDDSNLVQHSANRSLFSMLFHGTGAKSLVRGKVPGADAPARVLRPRKQKQKRFIKRRRRFVEVRYRESDAYWVLSRKVKVFWPLDKQWYFGEIKSYNPNSKLHYIQYDDRDEEWLSLGKERFKLLLHEGELDDHAYDSRHLEGERVNVQQEFHSPIDESTGSFLDSEPIISWLARSSSRASLSSLGTVKVQKKASASGNDLATCVLSEDSSFAKKKEHDVMVPGFALEDASVPLQEHKAAHRDEDEKNDLVQFDLISNKRKAPIVYFRRRYRRRKECVSHIMEKPSSGSVLSSVSFLASVADKIGALEGLESPASDQGVKPPSCEKRSLASKSLLQTMQNVKHASAGFGTFLMSTDKSFHQGNSDLKLEHRTTSKFTSNVVKLDHIRFILCIPSHWLFSPKVIAKDMEFLTALQLVNFGEINPVWPKVHLEMMIIDKVVTLNILLFEGCLGHAVTLLCSILLSFCTSKVSKDSFSSMEFSSATDVQLPCISIRFKLLGDKGRQAGSVLFVFLKTETSSCKGIHASDNKLGFPSESLPSAEPAGADVRFLKSTDSPVDSLALEETVKSQEFAHQHVYRSCNGISISYLPGISVENIRNLSAIALSFAATPTFFLSLHLKLMMESAIASSFFQNSSMEKNSGCNKRIFIKGKDGLVIQPSSELTNPQAAGYHKWVPKHGVVVSAPPSIASTGHWLKCDQQPSDRKLNAAGIPVGIAGLKRDHPFDDAHSRTVIRLRRYPCNMGSWQYAGGSRPSASTVPPLSADSVPTCIFSSTVGDDRISSPSSQLRSLPFERVVGSPRNQGSELVGNIQDGNFRQQSTTAPRSVCNNNRIKSARKSFSCRSKSWQEGRSGLLYTEFIGRSWKHQNLASGSSPSDDRASYQHGRLLRQANDDNLRRSLGNSASPHRFLDSLSCGANILVTVGDRGWRECGAQVMLASVDHNDWRLLVKIEGSTRYSYKAHQILQPGVTNRSNHAIIWKGGKDWSLEFVNRSDYALFKEMHEECYNRNIRAASVKNIPIPGVRRTEEDEATLSAVPFVRGARYFRQVESDIEMALNPSRVLYDMDDEDEEWLMQFRKSLDIDEGQVMNVSDEIYERAMDALEKVAYAQQCEEFSCEEVERITSGIGPFDIMDAIYEHWRMKRRKKRMPLIRQFQPPLWEQYQRQLKEWESVMAKVQSSSYGCTGKGELIEKPPMFAFCLRPRGLEVPNKGSKQRSHRKFPAVGFCNAYPRELESCSFNGRKMNGSTVGDERAVNSYASYDYSDASPRVQLYSGLSPRYTSSSGPLSRNSDWLEFNQSPRVQHINKSKKMGGFVPSAGYASGSISRRNGVLHLQRPAPCKWPRKQHYQSDGSSMEQSSDQSGSTDREEIRLRDPVAAAQQASELAKLKRSKAQRLLQRADLALHKAMVALVTAELIQAAENDSAGGE